MVAIYICLLKALHWITLLHQHIQKKKVTPQAYRSHYVFHSFFSDESKHDYATTTAHSKRIIELLKQRNSISNMLSTIWENTDGCADHYICATALYLTSMLSQEFSIIIDRGISAPGHGR